MKSAITRARRVTNVWGVPCAGDFEILGARDQRSKRTAVLGRSDRVLGPVDGESGHVHVAKLAPGVMDGACSVRCIDSEPLRDPASHRMSAHMRPWHARRLQDHQHVTGEPAHRPQRLITPRYCARCRVDRR